MRPASSYSRWNIAVSVIDGCATRPLNTALRGIGIPFREVPTHLLGDPAQPATVACVCSRTFATTQPAVPTVTVCCGASLSDRVWLRIEGSGAICIDVADLRPDALLAAMVRARVSGVPSSLSGLFDGIPAKLVRAFLWAPGRMHTLAEIAGSLRLPPAGSQQLIRDAGFGRVQHCTTWMTAETWIWLMTVGAAREVVEEYLGIVDRSDFRRACRRAGIPVPWSGGRPPPPPA